MSAFGLSEEELDRRGARWTAREIAQQPQVWETLHGATRGLAEAAAFAGALRGRPGLRIVLTGAGTSSFIGECLAPALLAGWQCWAEAIPTTDLVAGAADRLVPGVPTLLVSFARSGDSPESVAALDAVQALVADCHHIVVTCNPQGALAGRVAGLANARVVLLPDETNDRSFAMTSSFTSMLMAAAGIFGVLAPTGAAAAAASGRALLAGTTDVIASLVGAAFERAIFLGAGALHGLAKEAALKMLELSDGRVVAMADSPLGFRHGPKTVVQGRTLVVVLLSNRPRTRRYDLDLLRELRTDRVAGRVLALSGQPMAGPDPDDVLVPGASAAGDLELCLSYVLFAQALAMRQSIALGLAPDRPNAAGTVHRVVRGVTIYPLTEPSP
jgi:tagatose-6-phosphate ketose/aldose isomerase